MLGLELILVLVLLVGGLCGRVLFRRPWTIRATASDGRTLSWRARGWRASGRVRDEAARGLGDGREEIRPADAVA